MTFSAISSIERLPSSFVFPVLAGIEQSAEIAGDFAESENLIDDAVHVAGNDQVVDDEVQVKTLVGEVALRLENLVAISLL